MIDPDLLVVGAGPAGRALAHRALAAGLHVTLIDPDPDRAWAATFGLFLDDLPDWVDRGAIAASAASVVVYTPRRRDIARGYAVLDAAAFQAALTLDGAHVVTGAAAQLRRQSVLLADGTTLRARWVIDARGTGPAVAAPRQTASGVLTASNNPSMVLMDWRPVDGADPHRPSFHYRVPIGDGRRLLEETCLAGDPPISVGELALRNAQRVKTPGGPTDSRTDEYVDFPLLTSHRPWRRPHDAPLRFGAGGGLMHPASGYSIAQSLGVIDRLVCAINDDRDPHSALWPIRARVAYRLKVIGLAVLLGFTTTQLTAFFDAFFQIPPAVHRRYLSGHDDAVGTIRVMIEVIRRVPWRLRLAITGRALVAAVTSKRLAGA